ncbi:MAG: helix-turn-helix transcriptional regulator [Paracoccaceae bacterium]
MTARKPLAKGRRRYPAALALFIVIESLAAGFFLGEALSEMLAEVGTRHGTNEGLVAVALLLGVAFGAIELRRTLKRMRAQETQLMAAKGALADVISAQFAAWGLTPAERDVAMFALKGLDVADIAEARTAAQGTVRAQLTNIYAKAGVSGRAQFAALFVEDLLSEGVG